MGIGAGGSLMGGRRGVGMRVMEKSSAGRFTSRRGWAARRVLLGGLAACLLAALGAAPAGAFTDLSGGAFQILAPGEEGGYPPNEFSTDLLSAKSRRLGFHRRLHREHPVTRSEHRVNRGCDRRAGW